MHLIFKFLPKCGLTSILLGMALLSPATSFADDKQDQLDKVNIQIGEEFSIPQVDAAALEVMNQLCPSIIGKNKNFDTNYLKFLHKTFPGVKDPQALVASFKNDPVYIEAYKQAKADAATLSAEEIREACLDVATYEWPADSE